MNLYHQPNELEVHAEKTTALIIVAIYIVFCTSILLLSAFFGFLPLSSALIIWVFVIPMFLYLFSGDLKKIEPLD